MNVQLLKAKMQSFLSNVTAKELISDFEDLGYSFVDTNISWPSVTFFDTDNYVSILSENKHWYRFIYKSTQKNLNKVTPDFPGSFFLLKIAI